MLVDHYQTVVPIFVEHAIEIGRMDFLFVDMFDKLKPDSIAKGVFLEVGRMCVRVCERARAIHIVLTYCLHRFARSSSLTS